MAVQLAHSLTGLNFLSRTTGLVQGSAGSYSCCFWYRPDQTVTAGNYATPYIYRNTAYTRDIAIFGQDTQIYTLEGFNGTSDQVSPGQTLTAGHWYPMGYHRSGTSHSFYISTLFVGSITLDMSAATFDALYLGSDDSGDESLGTFAYFREWTAVLSPAEFAAEANARAAVRTANLVTDTSLRTTLLDATSNHNDWTGNGSFAFVADDPIPAGASAADPIVITLPYSTTVDVKPTNVEFLFDHWLKYTAVAPEVYIGGWFFGQLTVGQYRPSTTVFSDAGVTHYPPHFPIGPSGTQNLRFQMPVTAGESYWFEAVANWTNMTSHTLTIDFLTAPDEAIPVGSIFVNDDTQDFYAGVVSNTAGDNYHVLGYRQFITTASENGGEAMPANGNILIYDDTGNTTLLYDQNLTLQSDVGITIGAVDKGEVQFRRTSAGDSCYVGYHLTVKQVSDAGVIGGTTWTLTGTKISSMAPNNDETILYVDSGGIAVANKPIKQWNLMTSSYDADLVAGVVNSIIVDMLVLSDTSLLVLRQTASVVTVSRYSSAGALLHTYSIGTGDLGSIEYDFLDPDTYFLVRIFELVFPGSYTVMRVKLSDGTTTQVDHVQYNAGIYGGDVTASPIAKFGLSASCPFFPINFSTPTPASESTEYLIRRERWFPVISSGLKRQFFSKLQIDMQTGNGLSTGQGSNPLMEIDWSDDSGWTWSNIRFVETGRIGAYGWRPIARNLSYGRNRVFRIAVSDPVQWVVVGAELDAVLGTS